MSSRLSPAVAATRNAIRALDLTGLVLVACSGGADSLALAAAARFVASRDGWQAGLITVDHQLQEGSALRASGVAALPGFSPSIVIPVEVGFSGGPEAAARDARYSALAAAAEQHRASCVLLGHSEDDQAETVLLALARGAGPRGLSGMPVTRLIHGVRFARPFLGLSRETLRQACTDQELSIWDDPHNTDPAFARSRLRMSNLIETLGPDVVPNLARSAALIAADSSYLDSVAIEALARIVARAATRGPDAEGLDTAGRSNAASGRPWVEDTEVGGLSSAAADRSWPESLMVADLAELPDPIRTRVLHLWVVRLGAPRAALSHRHVAALDALITSWHGQGPVALPGKLFASRKDGKLTATSAA